MNGQYAEVPNNILTGKDLDYLSDMFQWNYCAYKKAYNNMEYINDQKLVDFFNEVVQSFDDNMNVVLNVISNPGGDIDE